MTRSMAVQARWPRICRMLKAAGRDPAEAAEILRAAMRKSGRCALAKWAWKAKQYVVQIRPAEGGLVLQQLLYAAEVHNHKELNIEQVDGDEISGNHSKANALGHEQWHRHHHSQRARHD